MIRPGLGRILKHAKTLNPKKILLVSIWASYAIKQVLGEVLRASMSL